MYQVHLYQTLLKGYYAVMESWIRTAIVVLATGIVGFLGAWQADALISTRGALGPTILQTVSPISSVIAILITVGIASAIGGIIARLTTIPTGMFILGFSLFGMAMKLHGAEEFIMSQGNYNLLILEATFLSVIVLLGTLVVFAIGGDSRQNGTSPFDKMIFSDIGKSILISLVILPVIWIIATSPSKGQVLGASALGGILIGVLARQFLHTAQPILLFAIPIAIGGLGYFIGMTIGETDIAAFTQQEFSALLYPMPIEYAAGLLIGLAIGLGWTSPEESSAGVEPAQY